MLKRKHGFTMVELLVVLVIIAILAAVATPLFLQNTKRAKVSEAVAAMGLLRQAERDYKIAHGTYFDVIFHTDGNIQDPLPPTSAVDQTSGTVTVNPNIAGGLDVDVGVTQYFSNAAYKVEAAGTGTLPDTDGSSGLFTNPPAVDFIITVDGGESDPCVSGSTANCAVKGSEVGGISGTQTADPTKEYFLEMDNTGRTFVCYGTCTTTANWSAY